MLLLGIRNSSPSQSNQGMLPILNQLKVSPLICRRLNPILIIVNSVFFSVWAPTRWRTCLGPPSLCVHPSCVCVCMYTVYMCVTMSILALYSQPPRCCISCPSTQARLVNQSTIIYMRLYRRTASGEIQIAVAHIGIYSFDIC